MMPPIRLSGPGAGAEKYDVLTAMAVCGLAAGGSQQASMLRLIALVTARYNWALDDLSIGQKDMARLWSVDERTAKRETKRLIDAGLLEVKRAGVRGRVASYRLCIDRICAISEQGWGRVGRDFADRMGARTAPLPDPAPEATPESTVVRVDFAQRPRGADGDPWAQAMARLADQQPKAFPAWFAQLTPGVLEGSCLEVTAPSRFVADYIATHLRAPLEAALTVAYRRPLRCALAVRA